MATTKLRKLDTLKGIAPAELEVFNWNFWAIEQALNSVGAVTPGSSGTPPATVVIRHNQLLGLDADDHKQYWLLLGRAGGTLAYGGINAADPLTLISSSGASKQSF